MNQTYFEWYGFDVNVVCLLIATRTNWYELDVDVVCKKPATLLINVVVGMNGSEYRAKFQYC